MHQGTWRVQEPRQHAGGDAGGGSVQIVCAWCQQPLSRHGVQTPTRFPISYSICGRCYGDVLREREDSTASTAHTPYVPADCVEGRARHSPEKRRGTSFLALLTEDIRQRAQALCLQAMDARQRAQDLLQTCQLERHMRKADQVERALWRDHRHRIGEPATLHLSSTN